MAFDEQDQPGEPEPEEDEPVPEGGPERGRRFYLALACYAGIALLATATLEGEFLWVVWIFLGGLALKTYIATLQKP